MANPLIQVENITRSFGNITAIDRVSFMVDEGEVFGLLGPNGAGKTTLVRLLNGVLAPTSGRSFLFGRDVAENGAYVRSRTGVLTETPSVYERLTARKNLHFFGRMYGIPEADLREKTDHMLAVFDLADRGDEPVGGFSKGMKQRLALARALIHDPPVIFLDEPTAGLDPEAARQVDGIIKELAGTEGRTIVLCTHNLNEAEHLSSRVVMLNRGRILATGSIQDLADMLWKAVPLEIEFLTPPPPGVFAALHAMEGISLVSQEPTRLILRIVEKRIIPAVIASVTQNGGQVIRVTPREYSLEEIYFEVQERGRTTV
jgi:ABC-2 type transport system ATP-binding protein